MLPIDTYLDCLLSQKRFSIMRRYFHKIRFFLLLLLFFQAPSILFPQVSINLDEAAQRGAAYLRDRFPRGTRAELRTVKSENPELSEFVNRKISDVLVNSNWFVIVERDETVLEGISR